MGRSETAAQAWSPSRQPKEMDGSYPEHLPKQLRNTGATRACSTLSECVEQTGNQAAFADAAPDFTMA
jgi:hypothetical protein